MDWWKTWLIATLGAVVVIGVWFGRVPAVQRARTERDGRPNLMWWVSLGVVVVLTAYLANQAPDYL